MKLQNHQRNAYNNVIKHFKEGDRSIVIFPTGCGKSFVSLQLMEDNKNKRILFIAPSKPIEEQMYGYIVKFLMTNEDKKQIESVEKRKSRELSVKEKAEIILPQFKAVLYQTMISKSQRTQKLKAKLKPDYIICDEAHHIKVENENEDKETQQKTKKKQSKARKEANIWGTSIKEFFENNPQAKILGITATPERGDGGNVAIEFFNGKIASEISLIEALTSNKIPVKAPDYIPCEYSLIDEIDEESIQQQIEKYQQTDKDKTVELEKKLEELRKIASSGKGIPDLFTKNLTSDEAIAMGRNKGRYIVFCDSIEDMKEKMQLASRWFFGVDKNPEIYAVSSDYNYSCRKSKNRNLKDNEIIEQFEESNSEHLKLLFSVNKLNEGLHVDDVSGVIMTRKTDSRIVYLQQLGRALSSDEKRQKPIVFDLVNNYINYNIYNELVEKRKQFEELNENGNNSDDKDEERDNNQLNDIDESFETFKIYGVMKNLLDLLNESNSNKNTTQEFIYTLKVLKSLGADVSKMVQRDTIESLCKKQGIKIEAVKNRGLDITYKLGIIKSYLGQAYREKRFGIPPTEEQVNELKKLGISFEIKDATQEFIDKLNTLKSLGLDVSKIVALDTIESLCKKQGVNIEKVKKQGLDIKSGIGKSKHRLIGIFNGKISGTLPTEEQVKELNDLGISLEMQQRDIAKDFIETLKVLKDVGVDLSKITQKDTVASICEKQNINIEELKTMGLDTTKKIGQLKMRLSEAYRGKGNYKSPTEEQAKELDELGISLKEKNATQEFIEKLKILKSLGIDVSKISSKDTIETLCKKQGISIEKVSKAGLDIADKVGRNRDYVGHVYRGDGKKIGTPPTKQQIEELAILGISLEKQSKNVTQDFIEKMIILKDLGVDLSKLVGSDTIGSICEKQGINIEKVEKTGLNMSDRIGNSKDRISSAYRGKCGNTPPTEEQVNILNELGISLEKRKRKSEEIEQAVESISTSQCDKMFKTINILRQEKNKDKTK